MMDSASTSVFRVVWIEDEYRQLPEFSEVFAEALQDLLGASIQLMEAPTVRQAEGMLRDLAEHPPDLILLDIILPAHEQALTSSPPRLDMNAGYFLWHRLRNRKRWGDKVALVPIVVVTARCNPEFKDAMIAAGNLLWADKPVAGMTVATLAHSLVGQVRGGT